MNLEELAEELRTAVGAFVRRAREVDQVGANQAAVLGHLGRKGRLSIAQLAALGGVRHQSMARTVHHLLGAALIHANDDPQDGRRVLLHLTDAGWETLERERQRRAGWIAQAIETQLSATERALLEQVPGLLQKLSR